MGYVMLGDVLILFGVFFGVFGSGSALTALFLESSTSSFFGVTIAIAVLVFFTGIMIQFSALKRNRVFPIVALVVSVIQLFLYCAEVLRNGFNWWLSPVQELLNSPETISQIGGFVGIAVLFALILLPAIILPLTKKGIK